MYDRLLQLRPSEAPDERIVIVGVTEADLQTLGHALITDGVMADLLTKIKAQQPRVIGLDLYRNLPTEPGTAQLLEIFRSTPNLIGIQKVIGDKHVSAVPGNPVLVEAGRVAASDVVVDMDGRVRRGLLFPSANGTTVLEGISLRVALEYLGEMGITPEINAPLLKLRDVTFPAVLTHGGGYSQADVGGYQVLLNPRSAIPSFRMVSAIDVLHNKISPTLMHDRIVMIGSISAGDSDIFFTSQSRLFGANLKPIYGVELHSHLVSQIISAVLDRRPLIQVLPEWMECLLIGVAAFFSVWLNARRLQYTRQVVLTVLLNFCIFMVSYALLLLGWWLPMLPMMIATIVTALAMMVYEARYFRALSINDELTQVANRRAFNEALQQQWEQALRSQNSLSLILCDVDYFKLYNDTYGHPQGDECLRQIAKALKRAMQRSTDLVARYGGEEFVVLLPQSDEQQALKVAETIRWSIQAMQLPHRSSKVSKFVTLSLGVASTIPRGDGTPETLVNRADLALYEAKQRGRNQAVLEQKR